LSICYWLRSDTLSEQQRIFLKELRECVHDGIHVRQEIQERRQDVSLSIHGRQEINEETDVG
jgi:hypothetical protein